MKFLVGLSIVLITIINISDLTVRQSEQTEDTQRPHNLFTVEAPYEATPQTSSSSELWESTIYEAHGVETQVRWQKNGAHITAAKACTKGGVTVVAQATINLNKKTEKAVSAKVRMENNSLCQIELSPKSADNAFLIIDQDLEFSGENSDGTMELSIFASESDTKDGIFSKING